MLMRKYISYNRRGKYFLITSEGKKAWLQFLATDIIRKNINAPLTRYFNPVMYGLAKGAGGQ
jgi:hypothetical protein